MQTHTPTTSVDELRRALAEALDRIRLLDAELARANSSAEQARALAGRLADLHSPTLLYGAKSPSEIAEDEQRQEAQRTAERAAKDAYILSLERELDAMRGTKLFRAAAPFRRAYAWLRTSGSHRRS
jgi:hypothetical protein